MTDDRLLTLKEIASKLNISIRSAYRLADKGEIPAKKIGKVWRVDPVKFDDYLKTDWERKYRVF
jgi:excisionase family DNA binding protein